MSPLCSIGGSTAGPVRWAADVQGLYEEDPDYIKELGSPMRDLYKTPEMWDQDMLKTEVHDRNKLGLSFAKLRLACLFRLLLLENLELCKFEK